LFLLDFISAMVLEFCYDYHIFLDIF